MVELTKAGNVTLAIGGWRKAGELVVLMRMLLLMLLLLCPLEARLWPVCGKWTFGARGLAAAWVWLDICAGNTTGVRFSASSTATIVDKHSDKRTDRQAKYNKHLGQLDGFG